jgi:RNA polymerase sigma factor (TIGR02999 family)
MEEDLTALLHGWRGGDAEARDRLLERVYDTLCAMASARLRRSEANTLQPTAVVNEALIRLLGTETDWQDRAHFFALAALKMRAVLVDHARSRAASKRGGDVVMLTLSHADREGGANAEYEVLALHQALERLADRDERAARGLEMAYFGGMAHGEIACVLGVSIPTVERDLRFARAWLNQQLS